MREITIFEYCTNRDGKICAICKVSIEEELKKYNEYVNLQTEIKKQIRELQRKVIEFRKKYITIDVDHIKPRSIGGINGIENYQITHKLCNSKKGNNI
jgi:hypothetical protein